MAKVERPLFSDEATGRIGLAASFKKGAVWNSIVPQFHRVKSESEGSVRSRSVFKICIGVWRSLNVENKNYCNENAPAGWTGYQYFMGMCIKEGESLFIPCPHAESHGRGGSDEIIPSGKITLRPTVEMASIGAIGKPTIESVGIFRCFSLPIWNDKANSDEELYYAFRVPFRWDGISDLVIPLMVALNGVEYVGDKFKLQLAWEHDSCEGVIPSSSNIVEIETDVLVGRNLQYDSYCQTFTIDHDIDGAGNEAEIGSRVEQIRRQVEETTADYDREKLQERVAKLAGGVAVIKVGAATEVEMKEKKARVEDALHATRAAVEEGVVPGGGVAVDLVVADGGQGCGQDRADEDSPTDQGRLHLAPGDVQALDGGAALPADIDHAALSPGVQRGGVEGRIPFGKVGAVAASDGDCLCDKHHLGRAAIGVDARIDPAGDLDQIPVTRSIHCILDVVMQAFGRPGRADDQV